MKKILLSVLLVAIVLFFSSYYLFLNKKPSNIKASPANAIINDNNSWNAGILDNIATISGDIKISDKSSSPIDLWALYQEDNSRLTAETNLANASNVIDGDTNSKWEVGAHMPPSPQTWQFDTGSIRGTSLIKYMSSAPAYGLYLSANGSDWSENLQPQCLFNPGSNYLECNIPATSFRYIWIEATQSGIPNESLIDLIIYSTANATHTTGVMQIDGGENFWQWENFETAYTLEANSSVKYRFRTSTNGSSWTSWSGYQTPSSGVPLDISSTVTSRSGDTKYRYLQVQSRLENTDGVATPTIDSLKIDYHTEVKPTAPSAQTATTQ